jgi:hypothetical protein
MSVGTLQFIPKSWHIANTYSMVISGFGSQYATKGDKPAAFGGGVVQRKGIPALGHDQSSTRQILQRQTLGGLSGARMQSFQ